MLELKRGANTIELDYELEMKPVIRKTAFIRRRVGHASALLIAVAAFGCGACGPSVDDDKPPELPSEEGRRYAEALCKAIETCGCAQPFGTMDACETEYRARFDNLLEAKFDVSRECFEGWLDDIQADPCGAELPPPGDPFPCASLRGGKKKGASCRAHLGLVPLGIDVWPLRADECGTGLSCLDAQCVETPQTNEIGTFGMLGEGDPCGPTYLAFCTPWRELYCDSTEGVCRERKPLGAECSSAWGCEACDGDVGDSLHCEGATPTGPGTCAVLPRVGEPCDPMAMVACGACDNEGWCDPATSTCVQGDAPRLCTRLAAPAL